jgi:hypothetical protein
MALRGDGPIGHLSEAPGMVPGGVAATAGEAWPQKGRGVEIPERPVGSEPTITRRRSGGASPD